MNRIRRLEGREEAKFTGKLLESEARARRQPPTTLVQDIREAPYGEEDNKGGES